MRSDEREAVARRALALTQTSEAEVVVLADDLGLTRFTRDGIHQNLAERDVRVRIRAVMDGAAGVAETNARDEAALRATAERALALAMLAPRDADFPGLPAPQPVAPAPPHAFAPATADATPELRGAFAREAFAVADETGLWPSGYASTATVGVTVANSRGVLASFDGTRAAFNVKQNGSTSTGFAERYAVDVARVDGSALARIAADKALRSGEPQAVEPGEWTVILEPPALGELLSYLAEHFGARAVDEGSSFLCDGLERAYAGSNVTLRDDATHPLAPGMPFDFEGIPRRRLTLLERGVARTFATDSYWAAKLGRENTGHALPAAAHEGPHPVHLVLEPGEASLEQLIAETERGLLVSRFWYIRPVDRRRTIVTGMTRDGTFLIERGRITAGVRNMRFNQSILEALCDVTLSREVARTAGFSYEMVVPAAKFGRFRFDSATAF